MEKLFKKYKELSAEHESLTDESDFYARAGDMKTGVEKLEKAKNVLSELNDLYESNQEVFDEHFED